MINIEFDDTVVNDEDITKLSKSIIDIVKRITNIDDVFVYANSARIKLKISPIEIFVSISAHKIQNLDDLFEQIKKELSTWKSNTNLKHPINLTVIPMNWKFETGI